MRISSASRASNLSGDMAKALLFASMSTSIDILYIILYRYLGYVIIDYIYKYIFMFFPNKKINGITLIN